MSTRLALALALAATATLPAVPASADHRITNITIVGARSNGVHTATCAAEAQNSTITVSVTCSVGNVSQQVTTYGSRGAAAVAGLPNPPTSYACARVEIVFLGFNSYGGVYKGSETESACAPILVD